MGIWVAYHAILLDNVLSRTIAKRYNSTLGSDASRRWNFPASFGKLAAVFFFFIPTKRKINHYIKISSPGNLVSIERFSIECGKQFRICFGLGFCLSTAVIG